MRSVRKVTSSGGTHTQYSMPVAFNSQPEIIESPFIQIIADLAKNNKNLTPKLQDAIAAYLNIQTVPIYSLTPAPAKKDKP